MTGSILLLETAKTQPGNFIHATASFVGRESAGPKDRYSSDHSAFTNTNIIESCTYFSSPSLCPLVADSEQPLNQSATGMEGMIEAKHT